MPDAVAAVLGVSQQLGKTVSESVAAALEGRSRLLVFDNCEHVLDAAADIIEAILGHSASVRILATSREGLGVAEEQLWPVSSLDVAAGVDLFIERARSVAPDFAADNSVAQICKRLDGIPLAIELAASRLSSMTADEIHNRLDHRFKLLVGSRRGLERHQTLRHAVTWSYELLDDAERELLTRCSVFVGGFDVESACAISASAGGDEYAILDRLDTLVRKSLLVADRSATRTRFSMLETIRQFAEERLDTSGDADEVRWVPAQCLEHWPQCVPTKNSRRESDEVLYGFHHSPRVMRQPWRVARHHFPHGRASAALKIRDPAQFATYAAGRMASRVPESARSRSQRSARASAHLRQKGFHPVPPQWQCPRCGRIMFWFGAASHLNRCREGEESWPEALWRFPE